MQKPRKPDLSGQRLYFFFVRKGNSNKIELLSEQELDARIAEALAKNLERDGEEHLDYEDEYWDEDIVPLRIFMSLVSALPSGVDWVLEADYARHSESMVLRMSGTKIYTEEEKEQVQKKYEDDLVAYEKFKAEERAAKEARKLDRKKQKLEKLKKELGE